MPLANTPSKRIKLLELGRNKSWVLSAPIFLVILFDVTVVYAGICDRPNLVVHTGETLWSVIMADDGRIRAGNTVVQAKGFKISVTELQSFLNRLSEHGSAGMFRSGVLKLSLEQACVIGYGSKAKNATLSISIGTEIAQAEFRPGIRIVVRDARRLELTATEGVESVDILPSAHTQFFYATLPENARRVYPIGKIRIGGRTGINGVEQCDTPIHFKNLKIGESVNRIEIDCAVVDYATVSSDASELRIEDIRVNHKMEVTTLPDTVIRAAGIIGAGSHSEFLIGSRRRRPERAQDSCPGTPSLIDVDVATVGIFGLHPKGGLTIEAGESVDSLYLGRSKICGRLDLAIGGAATRFHAESNDFAALRSFHLELPAAADRDVSIEYDAIGLPPVRVWDFSLKLKEWLLARLLESYGDEIGDDRFQQRMTCAHRAFRDFQRETLIKRACDPFLAPAPH